jgi:uncharacterized protein (DUF362 family)/NAD-dependent dihydropyrimidine dehydrogenase PreA subunit
MQRVMIHPAEYENCAEAIDRAFELFPMDLKGKRVLVKPNVLRSATPEEGIATHPAVLKAVVERLETMGPAAIVVGDNPGVLSYGANEASFRQTGLMDAAKGYYRNIGNEAVEVNFNPDFSAKVSISRAIRDADVLISLPKFKTHGLTVVTGAIKNSYGFLPGAQKARLHRQAGGPERFHEAIVDVFCLRVPDLVIVDAVVGMEGNGPACPDLRHIGRILASDNAVALDATMARMMGLEPDRLRFLRRAKEMGLGAYEAEAIEIIGELTPIPDFKVPALGGEAIAGNPAIAALVHQRTLVRPKADPDRCTGCGTCVDQCPVSALALVDDLPVVNPDLCIACFCCQEICPEKAMALQ